MALVTLAKEDLRRWLGARGVVLVLVAALVPSGLTAAWVLTHQNDLVPVEIRMDPGVPMDGDSVNFTAVVSNGHDRASPPFNVTLRVGYFQESFDGLRFRDLANETFSLDALRPGATHEVRMQWTAQAGTYVVQAMVDPEDEVAEIEERNNVRYVQVQVGFPAVTAAFDPPRGGDGNGSLPRADLAVAGVRWEPSELYLDTEARLFVRVEHRGGDNVTDVPVSLGVHRAALTGYSAVPTRSFSGTVSLAANESTELSFEWRPNQVGQYALYATIGATAHNETAPGDNAHFQEVFIDRRFLYEEPEPKATLKDFYGAVLGLLHFRILIPLIALFFAAGVLEDQRGSLPYVLTRPVPRWTLPVSRFLVGSLVAGVGILLGIALTYILLLGAPASEPGHFWFPLAFAFVTLLVYGAVFTFVGVAAERPYLWGLAYVLGVEFLILAGKQVLVNGRPLLTDWVDVLSLHEWVMKAFAGWNATQSEWAPEGAAATQALIVLAAVAVVSLVGAAAAMRRREFA